MRVAQVRVLGGAVARLPVQATAYAHCRSRIMVNIAAFYDGAADRAVREAWVTTIAAALQQDDIGAYVNFLVEDEPERIRQAYPGGTWTRLSAIKQALRPRQLPPRQPQHPFGTRMMGRVGCGAGVLASVLEGEAPPAGLTPASIDFALGG